ncbi:MAG: tyrosine-protein phosphatase [Dermatophilaceae bacterium]
MTTADRWIGLDGVVNMRDLGGLPTQDGGQVQPRRLIRSDHLQQLSPAGVTHLVDELGVTDVVDLRTETELRVGTPGPLHRPEKLNLHHHALYRNAPGDHTTQPAPVESRPTGEPRRDTAFWAEHYLGYLTHRAAAVSATLRVVADARSATVVHCAAGKDRTGTVVALALDVAGVPHDEIVADYLLTAERLDAILARSDTSYSADDERPRPESIRALLSVLGERWGGAAGWLRAHGWPDDDIARLRGRLTTP